VINKIEVKGDGPPRFWVVDDPPKDKAPFSPCFGVCDEEAGGIVAYFNNEDEAKAYKDAREAREKVFVSIDYDEYIEYSDALGDFGTFVCWHRRSNLGHINYPKHEDFLENVSSDAVKIPIYCYEHSGIALSTGAFSCPWDSGQVGVWVFEPEDIAKIYGSDTPENRKKAEDGVQSQIKYINAILSGSVYQVHIEDGHGDTIDSLSSIVVMDDNEVEDIVCHFEEKLHDAIREAWEKRV